MKKSQRLRLAALQAKDAATLTPAEAAEMALLQTQAAAHPDASQDLDDTQPMSAAGFMEKLLSTFKAKATLAAELAAEKQKSAALQVQLDAAAAAKPAADTALTEAQTALTAANTQLTTANAVIATFAAALGLEIAALAGKDAAAARAAVDARVQALSTEQLASLGFPSSGLPPASSSSAGGDTIEDLNRQIAAETDPEKTGQLIARVKALRAKAAKAGK